jgi:hypothetical protein
MKETQISRMSQIKKDAVLNLPHKRIRAVAV